MKIYIDLSVFLNDERSLGQVFGNIELPGLPIVGVGISFRTPAEGVSPVVLNGFSGTLKVTDLQLTANSKDGEIVASLEDVVVADEQDGRAVMEYLRAGFSLFVDEA